MNWREGEFAPQGRIAYQFSAKGHELAQVLLGTQLDHPHDAAAVYYRSRPFHAGIRIKTAGGGSLRVCKNRQSSEGGMWGVRVFHAPRAAA